MMEAAIGIKWFSDQKHEKPQKREMDYDGDKAWKDVGIFQRRLKVRFWFHLKTIHDKN